MWPSLLLLLSASSPPREIEIESFGRYAITVESKYDVALELVDKVTGPGGRQNGRIDAFLDRGKYRVLTYVDPRVKDDPKPKVHPFRELNGSAPPALVELKPIDGVLGDFEQRSYWIDLSHRRAIVLEAAGRNLADLRLWRDGTWLVDAEPIRDIAEPQVGRPLNVFRIAADLEPGLYLVTAYGGPASAWAEDDGRHPFHLRYGIPEQPSALRKRFVVGPFGYDRFVVPGANYFRIELPEARPLTLEVKPWSERNAFTAQAIGAEEIAKNSVPPIAELDVGADGPWMITIRGTEGQAYVLQHFRSQWYTPLPTRGDNWVSTVHAGHAEDSIDATAVIVDSTANYRATAWDVVELARDRGWKRTFNLLEAATVIIDVKDPGRYELSTGGSATASFQMQPFMIYAPPLYQAPSPQYGGNFVLDRGLHLLTIVPDKQGVLEVTLGRGRNAPMQGQTRFGTLAAPEHAYWIYLGHQPGVQAGLQIRAVPIDLRQALSLTQAPNEEIEIPALIAEEGLLFAEAEDGSRLEISIDGGAWKQSLQPATGSHTVRVRAGGTHLISYSLMLAPKRYAPDTPLPPLPDGRLAQLPDFPLLEDAQPRFLDLERRSEASFLVRAGSPALFRLESTGLLATEGNLRTRMSTSVLRAEQNGIGRNFLVQQYLGTGDYQVTVRTAGETRGHLGLRLKRTPEHSGGRLVDGIPARATLPAGHTIVYPFEIAKAGQYRLSAIGRDRSLRCRLEDSEGWPLVAPNVEASFDRRFEAGRYRLVVLPEPVDVRVVALLEKTEAPAVFAGHGPHAIALDREVEHTWIESKGRAPDVWSFTVPAEIEATIALGEQMHGDLIRGAEKVAYVPPARGWSGVLRRGEYRLEVRNLHEGSDVLYTVEVKSRPLVVGSTRELNAPATIPLAIGAPSLVELSSFGSSDVEARLIDAEGRTIAKSDDRPDDWNFHLAARLEPGRYALAIAPVGRSEATTSISVRSREEVLQDALRMPVKLRVAVGRKVHVFPIALPDGFVAIAAKSAETLGLVLEEENDGGFRPIATSVGRPARIELPLAAGASKRKHRIKLWSADERNLPIDLAAVAIEPESIDEEDLAKGERVSRAGELPIAVAEVKLDRAGTFRVSEAVRWSQAPGTAAVVPARGLIHPAGARMWLVRDTGSQRSAQVKAKRIVLSEGALDFEMASQPIEVDLGGEGPVLVRVDAPKVRPAVCVGERVRPSCFDVNDHGAVSAQLDGRTARIWAAEAVKDPFDATLQVHRFAVPLRSRAQHGTLKPGGAIAIELAPGLKRVSVSMEEGAVAVLSGERVAWSRGETETFEGRGQSLVLLNPLAKDATYSVEALPLAEATSLAGPYERRAVRAGRDELIVPAGSEDRRVFVRGGEAVLIDADGSVQVGERFLVRAGGGSLRVKHGVGMVMAWIDPPNVPAMPELAVSIPTAIAFDGKPRALRFESGLGTAIHVRIDSPVIARWEREGAEPEVLVREEGGTFELYLPRGRGKLSLRGIGGGLHGTAEITSSAVETLGEGLGPEVMIAPGASRAFVFEVKKAGPIGIGVRADAADVEAVLTAASGRTIGRGVVQMHTLDAGTYVLALSAPDRSRPARARPAVVGIAAPPTGPPAEIIQGYLAP